LQTEKTPAVREDQIRRAKRASALGARAHARELRGGINELSHRQTKEERKREREMLNKESMRQGNARKKPPVAKGGKEKVMRQGINVLLKMHSMLNLFFIFYFFYFVHFEQFDKTQRTFTSAVHV